MNHRNRPFQSSLHSEYRITVEGCCSLKIAPVVLWYAARSPYIYFIAYRQLDKFNFLIEFPCLVRLTENRVRKESMKG